MNNNPLLLGFAEYREQGSSIANALSIEYHEVRTHYFPDGEVSVTLPSSLPEQIIVCRSLNNPNNKLIELILAINTARELGAFQITLIAPYLCYMRQDIAFHPGEAVSQKIIGQLLTTLVDTLVTVDPHLHRTSSLNDVLPDTKSLRLSAAPLIGEFIAQHFQEALIVGPDEESLQWVSCAAEKAGLPFTIARKTRNSDKDVDIRLPVHDFSGKTIVLLDDIISSGHTISQSAQALKHAGAGKIHVIATHALFNEQSQKLLTESGVEKIWSTNSVPHPTNSISLAEIIATGLQEINNR